MSYKDKESPSTGSVVFKVLGCGTSTGVPIPACKCEVCSSDNPRNKRNRTSGILLSPAGNILIDASPDLRHQAIAHDISQVDAVVFTHSHADHILGLEDLRGFNFIQRQTIPLYCFDETAERLRHMFSYIFAPNPGYQGGMLAQVEIKEFVLGKALSILGYEIRSTLVMHGSTKVAAFRIGDLGYATDCNAIPPESIEVLRGVKHLIIDGLRMEPHTTHFSIPEAIEMGRAIEAEQTYFTHMTHSVEYEATNAELPDSFALAYDGLEIDVGFT